MPNILLVDDDPDILRILTAAFESAGHEVRATVDPVEVAPLLIQRRFDAVVLDVMMPRLSGWDLLEDLRRDPRTERLPVLMLSAIGDSSNRVRGIRLGADDFLAKPFHPEEILARIEGLLERRRKDAQGLQGDFASFSPDAVLQALETGEAWGTLDVSTPGGDGCLRLSAGRCASATFAGLAGAEAVLALLGEQAGSFRLRVEPEKAAAPAADPDMPPLQALLMEAAWIEDELRARRAFLPPEDRSLYLAGDALAPLEAKGLPPLPATALLSRLRTRPGTSLGELLASGLAAPDRVRLGIAWLIENRRVCEDGPDPRPARRAEDELASLLQEIRQESELRGFPADPVEISVLVEPFAWTKAAPVLAADAGRLTERQLDAGVRLHVRTLKETLSEPPPWLRRSAAVILWLSAEANGEACLAAEAVLRQTDPRAFLLWISPVAKAPRPDLRMRRMRCSPRDLADLLAGVLSPLQEETD